MSQETRPEGKPISPDKVEINIERYGQLLEVDLWSKFQSRLWAIGGALLTIAALLGLFGIPIIVDTKINNVFADRTKKFDETIDNYLSLYRTYFHANSLITQYRYRLNADILSVTGFLDAENAKKIATDTDGKDQARERQQLISILRQVATEPRAEKILESRFLFRSFDLRTLAEHDVNIPISEMIRIEITSLSGASASMFQHPLRTGKLSALIADIQFRLVLLSGFEKALEQLGFSIMSLGGGSAYDKKAKVLQVESYMQTKLVPSMMSNVAASFNAYSILVPNDINEEFGGVKFAPLFKYYMKEAGFPVDEQKINIMPTTVVMNPPPKKENVGGPR